MADNIQLNPGSSGDVLAADDVGGIKFQRVKVVHGADGSALDCSSANPLPVGTSGNGTVNLLLSRYLDTNGDGTGTKNATGDYSVTPETFYIAPAAGEVFRINRLLILVEDTAGMEADEYGNLGSALANGITARVHNGTATVVDLTDGIPITTNAEWGALCYDVDLKTWGTGNEFLLVRWTLAAAGVPIRLDGDATEALELVLNDNLTGLVAHKFLAQGYQEQTPT